MLSIRRKLVFSSRINDILSSQHPQIDGIDGETNGQFSHSSRFHLQTHQTISIDVPVQRKIGLVAANGMFELNCRSTPHPSKLMPLSHNIQVIDAKKSKALNETEPVVDILEDDLDTVYTRPQTITDAIYRHVVNGNTDEKSLKDHILMMMFAGNDTSSVAMSHILVMLAIHQDIQQRVVDEVNRVLIDTPMDAPLTYETIEQLTYMERVIRETLRLYPVGPYLARECTEDTKISNCVVPAGCNVIVSVYSLQRRRDIWGPDADQFDPDRFDPSRMDLLPPASFLAFSRGARDCLG